MRLLVTRPEPQGRYSAAALHARGHEAVLAPLLHIEPLPNPDVGAGPWSALLMTSANAVRFLPEHPRRLELLRLPAFVVGSRTGEAARAAGFAQVRSAEGDAEALIALVRRTLAPGRLLYLAGQERAADLAGVLGSAGFRVDTVVVYRAAADTKLPDDVAKMLRAGAIDGVLHFSKRSAETFLAAAAGSGVAVNALTCKHFCLSAQVAEALARNAIAPIFIAARPEEAAVLDLVDKV